MALTYTRHPLSSSVSGRQIEVDTIVSPGTALHTVQATSTDAREEVHIYAANRSTASAPLTIELGDTGQSDKVLTHIPSQDGLHLIIPGISFTATTTIIRAFTTGTATNDITISGWVNRAT